MEACSYEREAPLVTCSLVLLGLFIFFAVLEAQFFFSLQRVWQSVLKGLPPDMSCSRDSSNCCGGRSGDSMWADEAEGKRGNRGAAPLSERPHSGGLVWSDSAMVNGVPEGVEEGEEGEEVQEDESDPHGLLQIGTHANGTHANGDALPVDKPEVNGYPVKALEVGSFQQT